MDSILNEILRPWRLEARKRDGEWHHDSSSGIERWRSVRHLGSGTFGDVSQEQCLSASSQNAVRAVKRISKRQAQFSQSSRRELEALITFSDTRQPHYQQHFVRFLGWFEDPTDLYIAMEFIEHGNLQQYIDQGLFPEPEAASVTVQVARALQFMHEKHFVHRDLKPMNILVSQQGPQWLVKVADFGIAKHTDGTAAATHGIGTPGYMAPELFGSTSYTAAVDVWALGAVAFCMRTGFPPFRTHMQLYDYHRDQTHFPVRALGSSSGFCMNFVLGTMTERPERRLTIEQVLAHDWLVIHTEEASNTTGHFGATMTSTWDIEPKNTWSNTYSGTSTVGQSLPTVLGGGSQHTDAWRTQSMSLPPPLDTVRPGMPRADTTSSTTSWRTGGSANTNSSTLTSVSSAPVSPPNARLVYSPKPAAPAGPPTVIPAQGYSSVPARNPYIPPLASSSPATQILSSDAHLSCQTCGKTFKTREYLMAHVRARDHTPQIPDEPPKVSVVEPPRIVATETAGDPNLTCGTCGKTFKERRYLMGHIEVLGHQVRSPSPPPPPSRTPVPSTNSQAYLTCNTCGKTFTEREYLMRHVEARGHRPEIGAINSAPSPNIREEAPNRNGGDDSLLYRTCATCNMLFNRREYLDAHTAARGHKPRVEVDPRLTCIACKESFTDRNDLFRHLERTGHARSLDTGKAEEYMRPDASRRMDNHGAHSGGRASYQEPPKPKPIEVDAWDTCLKCHKSFSNRNALFEHLRASGHAV
ncbi:kinase-like domain-containing protein [Nemania sp. NC0429]|nr:kinase-like domain-containing protein [Nemania sp. NC0429]